MVTVLLATALAAPSSHCFQQRITYAKPVYVAPVVKYVAPIQHVNVYYGVGQQVQLSALVTKQLRSDVEYQQFLRWKADKRAAMAAPPQPPTPMPMPPDVEPPDEPEGGPDESIPPPEPTPAPQEPPLGVATVAGTCAQCHSGPAPKGNFFLDGVSPISDISKPVAMIMTGGMPPLLDENGEQLTTTHRLTPLERYQIIEDLTRLKLLGDQP